MDPVTVIGIDPGSIIPQQARLHRLFQHDQRRQAQSRHRHHKSQHGSQTSSLEQQALRHRDRSEDICIHGHAYHYSQDHRQRILISQNGFYPGLRDHIVDGCAYRYPDKNIRRNFFNGSLQLIPGIFQAVTPGKRGAFCLNAGSAADKFFYISLHPQLFQQRTADDSNHQT